jgi:hypothetical protein
MKALISSHIKSPHNPLLDTVNTVARVYHIKPNENIHCFINIAQPKEKSFDGNYHITLISSAKRQLFRYELCVAETVFEDTLANSLNSFTEAQCWNMLGKHGFFIIDESTKAIDKQFAGLGQTSLKNSMLKLLNTDAIKVLDHIGLDVVPALYNWLVEADNATCKLRAKAFLDYSILLTPLLAPVYIETLPCLLDVDSLKKQGGSYPEIELSNLIDEGHAIEDALAKHYKISVALLASIRGKRYWEVTATPHTEVFAAFETQIDIYKYMANR